jgi:hypothetical protein
MLRMSMTIKEEDLGFDDLLEEMEDTKADHVAVGLLGDLESEIVNIGFWNEWGTKDIPPRPFIRQTFDNVKQKLKKIASILVGKIFDGDLSKKAALEMLGDSFLIEIRKAIAAREFEPNAAGTIKRKGSDLPLVDTGRLQQSLDLQVRKRGVENE